MPLDKDSWERERDMQEEAFGVSTSVYYNAQTFFTDNIINWFCFWHSFKLPRISHL